jgi:hypothetical protein
MWALRHRLLRRPVVVNRLKLVGVWIRHFSSDSSDSCVSSDSNEDVNMERLAKLEVGVRRWLSAMQWVPPPLPELYKKNSEKDGGEWQTLELTKTSSPSSLYWHSLKWLGKDGSLPSYLTPSKLHLDHYFQRDLLSLGVAPVYLAKNELKWVKSVQGANIDCSWISYEPTRDTDATGFAELAKFSLATAHYHHRNPKPLVEWIRNSCPNWWSHGSTLVFDIDVAPKLRSMLSMEAAAVIRLLRLNITKNDTELQFIFPNVDTAGGKYYGVEITHLSLSNCIKQRTISFSFRPTNKVDAFTSIHTSTLLRATLLPHT